MSAPWMKRLEHAYDDLAMDTWELVAPDATGGGLVMCAMRDASEAIKGADTDAALLSLEEAEGHIQIIRERIQALARGELPEAP